MDASWHTRTMENGEEEAVTDVVLRAFDAYVAPGYSPEGVATFRDYARPDALAERSRDNHFVLVAERGGEVAGMIEMRGYAHLSMLFVDPRHHRSGVGKELFARALDVCRTSNPGLERVTVNSSPYAVPIYERLGFASSGEEQVVNGMRFIPMTLELTER
jgi:GNAT superfamily N-acetyltransferase